MFFIQMYRPSERGVKNELEVHCVVAVLPLKCSHQLEPSGSPISDSALRGQYMMFKQESGVCVCGPHLVPLELDTNGYRYFTCGYWGDTVSIPHRGYQP